MDTSVIGNSHMEAGPSLLCLLINTCTKTMFSISKLVKLSFYPNVNQKLNTLILFRYCFAMLWTRHKGVQGLILTDHLQINYVLLWAGCCFVYAP